jgi:hypothetical protein
MTRQGGEPQGLVPAGPDEHREGDRHAEHPG